VTLRIYNLQGQLVRDLLHTHRVAGEHLTMWDGRNDAGRPAASGVYVLRLQSGRQVRSGRVMLLK